MLCYLNSLKKSFGFKCKTLLSRFAYYSYRNGRGAI